MQRSVFYDAVRREPFGGSLSDEQFQGTEALLDECQRRSVTDARHVAYILASVFHETGRYMLPIKETVYRSHKDKNPSDTRVKARLEAAWKAGNLSWVKTPYWRSGWFGRGQIQLTHEANYRKLGKRIGVDLVKEPSRALDLDVSAAVAVVGMVEGLFTEEKLSDYFNASKTDWIGARKIVNGDGEGKRIATYAKAFHAAIEAAQEADPPPDSTKTPQSLLGRLWAAFLWLFK